VGARVGAVLGWAFAGAVVAVLAVAVLVPRLGGATPYVILTGSMSPGMPPGTLVVARPVPVDRIGPGAVITYQLASGEPEVVTHRVVAQGISADGERVFRTQGDANPAPDAGWVRPVQVRGERWYAVPYLGYLTTRITDTDRRAVQTALVAGLLGYAGLMLVRALRERRTAVTP
jgi:signal peptidase